MAKKDRVYKYLNPVGIPKESVDTFPLAPRLKTLDGKTIYFSICGEAETLIALEKRLKNEYPNVNWKEIVNRGPRPIEISDEEMKTCDGMIQGVAY